MSTPAATDETKTRRTLVLRPSSRAVNISLSGPHGVHRGSRPTNSLLGSSSRRSVSLYGGSKVLEKSSIQTPRPAVRVFDEEGDDVTPEPLHRADPGAAPAKAGRFLLEEISAGSASEQTTATGSFTMPFFRSVFGSSRISSQSTIESVNEEIEDAFSKRDLTITFPEVKRKREAVEEQVTEDVLKELLDVFTTETDTVSLLDIPSTVVSVDADDAEAIKERNSQYAELCRNKISNDKYVDRSMQTLNGAAKTKHVQSDTTVMVDAAMTITTWDMYETFRGPEQETTEGRSEPKKPHGPDVSVESSRGTERSMSVGSTASTVSASSSLKEVEALGNSLNTEPDLQLFMLSEKFQQCLQVMERNILQNSFQPHLAAYRQLPVLPDPDGPVKLKTPGKEEGDSESLDSPALDCLWVFSCELTRGQRVSSMAWNKKHLDLLAVGYGESDPRNQRPGLVCCWSLKNIMWPDRIIHCHSAVTSLDFSASIPSQLAVGMHDGSIAIYNVQSQDKSQVISSYECPNRHLGPVWQLRWIQQELSLTEEKVEALFSVGADGRVSKWFVFNNGLDGIDLMKIKRIDNTKRKAGVNTTEKMTESFLSALSPGLCFDFHPKDSSIYLTGTWEGLIHKCSCSNSQQFLETYRRHLCPVNCITWCPLDPDVFLSCSSDWTIQLWKQDQLKPVLSFASTRTAVCDVKWSPKWATVFGAVNEEQLEIWDLNSSILDPVIVQPAAVGVTMTSLLFAPQTDCVVVGNADGQVTVFQLRNLSVGEGSQVDVLEDILHSSVSR